MNSDTPLGLVNNTALLLALAVLYETLPLQKTRHSRLLEIFTGIFIGTIGLAVMLSPWQFSEGVFFDTRSILLSLTGLFFGLIPTTIAALMNIALRLYLGGAGTLMGVLVILTSAALGLIYRYFLRSRKKSPAWYELYGFGVIVHLPMLLWTFTLPRDLTFVVLNTIALPVMLIYPVGTVLLGLLLTRRNLLKQAKEELRASEERYRLIFNNSMDAVLLTAPDGRILAANPAACEIFDRTEDEIIQGGRNAVVDNTDPRLTSTLEERARTGKFRGELTFIRKDGSKFQGEVTSQIFALEDGQLNTSMIIRDITEKKQTEGTLRESEEEVKAQISFLDTVMEQSPFAMWISDSTGTLIRTNRVLRQALHLTDDQLLWKYNVLKDNNLKEQGVMPLARAVFEEQKPARFSIPWSGAGVGDAEFEAASDLWIDVSMFPILDGAGNLTNVVCQWVDITEQKRAEDALRDSEKTYRELIDGMNETVWVIDFDGNLIDVNKNAGEILGYSKEELLMIGLYDIDSSLTVQDIKALARAMPSDRLQIFETVHTAKDGKSFPVEVYSSLVTYQGQQAILSIARDITDRKQTESLIEQSRQQLRALTTYLQSAIEDERTYISREIHDEFGQRLTALKMDLVGASQHIPDGNPELAIRVGRMTALVDDTIDKIRQLSSRLRPGLLDDLGLSAAIEWQAASFQGYAGIECTLDLPDPQPDLPPELATGVFRIFQEALTNVARHSQATEVHVKLSIDKNELTLKVQDNGRGITVEEINRYASLGLLGMQERAKTWNGEVEFVGEQGKGTTVVVRIPLRSVKEEGVA